MLLQDVKWISVEQDSYVVEYSERHLTIGTIKWLDVLVFFVLLAALPETSGGKEDFVYLHSTYRIFCFIYAD
jgi:hypothetical protein